MDTDQLHQAMNQGAWRLAEQLRSSESGSWIRLRDYALATFGDRPEVVSLLQVAYEIGHRDGESCAEDDT